MVEHAGETVYRVSAVGIVDPATGGVVVGAVVRVTASEDAEGRYFGIYVEDGGGRLVGSAEYEVDRAAAVDRADYLAGR